MQRRLGINLPKADRLTDWLRRPLSDEARTYAAADVAHLDDLWASLRDELEARGRLAWALDECDEHAAPPRAGRSRGRLVADQGGPPAQGRPAASPSASPPGASAVPARSTDRCATCCPTWRWWPSPSARRARGRPRRVRGLDGRHLKGGAGEELLVAVKAGVDLGDDELRLPPRDGVDSTFRPAVTLASAWVSQLSRDAELDASLVATRADIEALVRGDGTSRLLTGWRADVAGLPVQRLLEGNAALAFDGEGSLVLEARSHQPPPGAAAVTG